MRRVRQAEPAQARPAVNATCSAVSAENGAAVVTWGSSQSEQARGRRRARQRRKR